ncbi:MAG: glycerate kinase [Bacteroidetes bacterium]|nr:glycerate kinase [Bacteroidota bacterium]
MNVLVAPDSFKGSLSAVRAAEIIAAAIARVDPAARCLMLPQADGGEGTVDALYLGLGGRLHLHMVTDPLGRPVQARWLQLPDGSALVESAACIGLPLLREDEREPDLQRSDGLGLLLRHLHERGYTTVYCGLGGSATNDAGLGMAEALGVRMQYRSSTRRTVRETLLAVDAIEAVACDDCRMIALVDVRNPLCGERGATAVYGPQKGIPLSDIKDWDQAVAHFASVACRDVRAVDPDAPGMGAAGGLGFALSCFTGAELRPGAAFVRTYTGFDAALMHADLVITGEGRIDAQSTEGKVLSGICGAAVQYQIPVVAFAGDIVGESTDIAASLGLARAIGINEGGRSAAHAMREVEALLDAAVTRSWPAISAMR